MNRNAIFLSIRPKYAEKIFNGTKTVELRRVRPKYIEKGALVLIYVSSPIQALVGAFKIDQILEKPVQDLWQIVHDKADVSQDEFNSYFEGISTGIGLFFSEFWTFPQPIELEDLQRLLNFQPPQGFRYVKANELTFPQFANLIEDAEADVQTSFLGAVGDLQ